MTAMMQAHAHPLDRPARQKQAEIDSLLSQFLAPGIRDYDLERLAEQMGPDALRALLYALQGVPGPEMPVGGD